MSYENAKARYRELRSLTKTLLEEEALATYWKRVDIVSIDDDILRRAERDWYSASSRRTSWDWDGGIMQPLRRSGARWLALAFICEGQLCGMMAARLSPRKVWLSLTHLEGAPGEHPLKGRILPLSIRALFVYRGVISDEGCADKMGVRVLNPLPEAMACYESNGYTLASDTKWLRAIVVAQPSGEST